MSGPSDISFNFYATVLDAYQNYVDSEKRYYEYYGRSEEPSLTIDEFEERSLRQFIDRLNRVEFTSDAADKGTAFNDVVDFLSHGTIGRTSIEHDDYYGVYLAVFNGKRFAFEEERCHDFAESYKGGAAQVYVTEVLHTDYGNVRLYGYIDELMPFSIHDIKTTSRYNAFKFRDHWQHLVYPYCVDKYRKQVFQYDVTDFRDSYSEVYIYEPERDIPKLREQCERLIEFLMAHRSEITDKKLFNLQ